MSDRSSKEEPTHHTLAQHIISDFSHYVQIKDGSRGGVKNCPRTVLSAPKAPLLNYLVVHEIRVTGELQ